MKWYKHDPSAALAGMIGLTLEERGAYYTLIDLQYARAPHGHGDVTDELVIGALAIRPHRWGRIKASLIAKGKVHEIDGKLTANRVQSQVSIAIKRGLKGVTSASTEATEQEVNFSSISIEREFKGATSAKINDLAGVESIESTRKKKKELASLAPKKARARRALSQFPEGWQPPDLPPDQQRDFDAFADHARTCARTCADWQAAWRNWHRKTQRMQQQERPNGRSLLAAFDRTIDLLGGKEAAQRYVPGSQGPRPLNLGRVESPNGVRRLPPR